VDITQDGAVLNDTAMAGSQLREQESAVNVTDKLSQLDIQASASVWHGSGKDMRTTVRQLT
jgi:hypothetical protein